MNEYGERLRRLLSLRNVQAFLRVLREGESSQSDDAYRMRWPSKRFDDLSRHPAIREPGPNGPSDAAGAYQFLSSTWRRMEQRTGTTDFSPLSQDVNALALIDSRGALDDVIAGRLVAAIDKLGDEWASLPSSRYGQPTKPLARLRQVFAAFGGAEDQGVATAAQPNTGVAPSSASPPPPTATAGSMPASSAIPPPVAGLEAAASISPPSSPPRPASPPSGSTQAHPQGAAAPDGGRYTVRFPSWPFPDKPPPHHEENPTMPAPALTPIVLAAAQSLWPVVADLMRGRGTATAERNAKIIEATAPVLVEVAKTVVPDAPNEQAAVERILQSPDLRKTFVAEVAIRWSDVAPFLEHDAKERAAAREFALRATAEGPPWRQIGYAVGLILVTMVVIGMFAGVSILLLVDAATPANVREKVLDNWQLFAAAGVFFWLGSSSSSRRKDDLIVEQRTSSER